MALPLPTELYAVLGMPPHASAASSRPALSNLAQAGTIPEWVGQCQADPRPATPLGRAGDREKRRPLRNAERGRSLAQGARRWCGRLGARPGVTSEISGLGCGR